MAMNDGYNNDRKTNYKNQIEQNTNIRPLQLNLLLIRETLRMLYMHSKSGISKVYNHLGISTDLYTKFLDTGQISNNTFYAVRQNLINAGFKPEYLKKERAKIYRVCGLDKLQKNYYDENYERDSVCAELRQNIHELFLCYDPDILHLVFVCYRLMNTASPSNEASLFVATESLQKVSTMKLDSKQIKSKIYYDYVDELSKAVKNLTNQYADKPLMDNKTFMNTITVLLQYIINSDISKEYVQSKECLQMMQEISKTMFYIYQTLNDE